MESDYEILGIHPDASADEIRSAYRDLAKVWHPDRFAHDPRLQAKAQEKLKEINEAYQNLSSMSSRGRRVSHPPSAPTTESTSDTSADTEANEKSPFPRPEVDFTAPPPPAPKNDKRILLVSLFLFLLMVTGGYYILENRAGRARDDQKNETTSINALKQETTEEPSIASPSNSPILKPEDDLAAGLLPTTNAEIGDEELLDKKYIISATPAVSQDTSAISEPLEIEITRPPSSGYITLGTAKDDVLEIQGTPDRFSSDAFHYGSSKISFKNGLVSSWENYYPRLKVKLPPTSSSTESFISVGSSTDDVLAIQGTPDRFSQNAFHYGSSSVHFSNGRVISWENYYPRLKVRLAPSSPSTQSYFTVGSTRDEVLSVQGTADRFTKDTLYYGSSSVYFVNGRVESWENYYPRLRVKLESRKPN